MAKSAPHRGAEAYLGSQEASRLLGMHRSTLFLAVKHKTLTPDFITPRGHYRFSQETLDAFATRLTREPVTSSTHAIAEMAQALGEPNELEHICRCAMEQVRRAAYDLGMCLVGVPDPKPGDPDALRIYAPLGVPKWFIDNYEQMGPHVNFASTAALRSLRPEVCNDVSMGPPSRSGTLHLARQATASSYAMVPVAVGNRGLGVLIAASQQANRFHAPALALLESVAADLAVALAYHAQLTLTRRQAHAAADVTLATYRLRQQLAAATPAARDALRRAAIATLVGHVRRATGAAEVYLTGAGFDLEPDYPEVWSFMRQATPTAPSIGAIHRADSEGIATALVTPLDDGRLLTACAIWHGACGELEAAQALLRVFVGACLLLDD